MVSTCSQEGQKGSPSEMWVSRFCKTEAQFAQTDTRTIFTQENDNSKEVQAQLIVSPFSQIVFALLYADHS